MSTLGAVHTAAAVAAMLSGLAVLLGQKGTGRHRRLGWWYAGSMTVMIATSFGLYGLSGRFNLLHIFSIWAAVTLLMGVMPARRKQGRTWVDRHYFWMTYSYVGLMAAAASEVATRLPGASFGIALAVASLVVTAAGAALIHTRGMRTLIQTRARWIR